MKTSSARGFALCVTIIASTTWVHAHPGHDGHELTWDFSHLAEHPLATLGWLGVAIAAGGFSWFLIRRVAVMRSTRISGPDDHA